MDEERERKSGNRKELKTPKGTQTNEPLTNLKKSVRTETKVRKGKTKERRKPNGRTLDKPKQIGYN